ncbi:hypothetical protein Ahy_A03g011807 isoform B [Arachis hypogaea]|uniref:non-specific serine/threonine protein kinase n=1 Tax=Arachis hypogaea TaxID=3818 RepID=A0A445DRS7_ARAHY|nr:hypothetical protein Ahy_A03g011807 isoform B [Arachis hypogaea]
MVQYYCEKNFLLASFHVILVASIATISHAQEPLAFNYDQFADRGDTLYTSGDVYDDNGSLQLTEQKKDSFGRVTYYKQQGHRFHYPFHFFHQHPNKSYDGDGITFYLAQPSLPVPDPRDGSGIGLLSRDQLYTPNYTKEHPFVAVEFDTLSNDWDPPFDHVGIDIRDIRGTYTTQWFSSRDERGYDAVITYNSSSNNLSVAFTGYKDNVTKIEQHLSCEVNLRNVLPEWVEFGFTSATGFYFEYHTLSSWSFNTSLSTHEANDQNRSKKGLVIGLGVGAGVLICVLVLASFMGWKLRSGKRRDSFDVAMDRDFERGTGPRRFSYEELSRATNNFAKGHKIGEGGFLRDLNIHVAIKKVSQGSQQGVREYASEVKIISQLRHKNLVQLIGWCHEQNDLLLVYEYVENGSLDSYLFKGKGLLTWEVRYKIARGLASALLYLHEEWDHCVLHRDIKPSNVMLDSNFNAKLGDFGLARLMDHGTSSKTTDLAGTLGYLAPEAATRGKASKESDVFSFGVVILEIACGRKVIEQNKIENQIYLVDWVWELYGTGIVLEAGDPRLYGVFDKEEMERLMIVGLWCTHSNYVMRPKISEAARVLNHEAALPTLSSQEHDGSMLLSRIPAFSGNNQTQPSTSSSSVTAGSSQSGSATSQLISPSSKILHTR